jgi:hypothetical protein
MLRSKRVPPPALALVILSRRLLFAIPTNSKNGFIQTTEEYMAFLHNEVHTPQDICN